VPPTEQTTNNQQEHSMKLNRIITLCAIAATLALSIGSTFAQAQDNGGGNNGGGRNRQGGGGGFQNMTPEERQKMMMDNVRQSLSFTNDTDWSAVQPLVQKVMDARRDVGFGAGMRGMFGRNRGGQGGRGGGGPGGMFGQASPEQEALQKALDDDAPAAQVKDLLAKYKTSQQAKQAKLEAAQDALKAVLTSKQEAEAYLLGLVR
jgi:hypothetical protein